MDPPSLTRHALERTARCVVRLGGRHSRLAVLVASAKAVTRSWHEGLADASVARRSSRDGRPSARSSRRASRRPAPDTDQIQAELAGDATVAAAEERAAYANRSGVRPSRTWRCTLDAHAIPLAARASRRSRFATLHPYVFAIPLSQTPLSCGLGHLNATACHSHVTRGGGKSLLTPHAR